MITKYTLNPVLLGSETSEGTYYLYYRYYYLLEGNKNTLDIPVDDVKLTRVQFSLLKENNLKGKLAKDILKRKSDILYKIKLYYDENSSYPNKTKLSELLGLKQGNTEINFYLNLFLDEKRLCIKEDSILVYERNLKLFINFFEANKYKKYSLESILNQNIFNKYHKYLKEDSENSNATIKTKLGILKDFLNFIAAYLKLSKPNIQFDSNYESEKLFLTKEELFKMINYDVENSNCRSNLKKSIINCQKLLIMNMFIGLRISEILNIKLSQIFKHPEYPYYIIKFEEKKKNRSRDVIIKDPVAMNIISELISTHQQYPFKLLSSRFTFNEVLKKLAKLSGLTDKVELYKDRKYITKEKWEFVSSHIIRRYAVVSNTLKYGIDIAMVFSGHSSYETIKKHYLKSFDSEEIYKKLMSME